MVGIKEIKALLSEWTYNLGALCRSSKVDKWSFYKPVNSSKMNALTTQDYYDLNDGFNIYSLYNPQHMLNRLQDKNTDLFTYSERTAPYRLSDFDGYIHNGLIPFELDFIGNNSGAKGDTLMISVSGDMQGVVNNWAAYRDFANTSDLVCLFFPRGREYDSSYMQTVYIYKVCNWVDFSNDRIPFKIDNSVQTGEYTIVPCITNAIGRLNLPNQGTYYYNPNSESPLTGNWIPFPPHCMINFSVVETSPSHSDYFAYFTFDEFEGVDFLYTPNNYELTDITFTNYIVYSPPSRTKTFDVTIEYYYYNVSNPAGYVLLGQAFRHFTFDNVLETVPINYRDTIVVVSDARLTEDIINITQKVYISSGGEQQIKEFSRTLEKNN